RLRKTSPRTDDREAGLEIRPPIRTQDDLERRQQPLTTTNRRDTSEFLFYCKEGRCADDYFLFLVLVTVIDSCAHKTPEDCAYKRLVLITIHDTPYLKARAVTALYCGLWNMVNKEFSHNATPCDNSLLTPSAYTGRADYIIKEEK
ncbi:unnamed protein product, partial [Acanthoscelides obtectus]